MKRVAAPFDATKVPFKVKRQCSRVSWHSASFPHKRKHIKDEDGLLHWTLCMVGQATHFRRNVFPIVLSTCRKRFRNTCRHQASKQANEQQTNKQTNQPTNKQANNKSKVRQAELTIATLSWWWWQLWFCCSTALHCGTEAVPFHNPLPD